MLKYVTGCTMILTFAIVASAEEGHKKEPVVEKIGTWNMHWLGKVDTKALENVDLAKGYADYIHATGSKMVALQEVVPSHVVGEREYVRCYYLDHIEKHLNELGGNWVYVIDSVNGNQRLGFLWDENHWERKHLRIPYPGDAYDERMRKPLVGTFQSKKGDLRLQLVNLHLKAMPDGWGKRKRQIKQLANWLDGYGNLDEDVVLTGDFNLYNNEMNYNPLKPLTDRDFWHIEDDENTNIFRGKSKQRFDRFIVSDGIKAEVNSAKTIVGEDNLVDAHTVPQDEFYEFKETLSDHFLVTLQIDVSEER